MFGQRPLSHRSPVLAAAAAASLVLGSIGLAAASAPAAAKPSAKAEPAPAANVEPQPGDPDYPVAVDGSLVRVKLTGAFLADLASGGASIVGTGATKVDGALLEIPMAAAFRDGYALAGGFALQVSGKTTYNCPEISIARDIRTVYCGKDGVTKASFVYGQPEKSTKDRAWTTDAGMNLRIINERRADAMNNDLDGAPLEAGDFIGDLTIVSKRLLKGYDIDSRTGCQKDNYAGDNSIWRGWAVQAMVNQIPENVGISQYAVTGGKGVLSDPAAPAVTIGQRTPYMDKINTTTAKKIIRGSQHETDNFYDGYAYGCNTKAPFIISQGPINGTDVKAWRYDGGLRNRQSNNDGAGSIDPQWWVHPRQTNTNGPTGSYTWTCRGLPANQKSNASQPGGDTWWSTKNSGSGFFETESDRDSGRAPQCADLNLDDLNLTTRYSISKRGILERRNDQVEYPRSCSVEGSLLVSCWQEIYPLWDRAWAFQYHVYASAMRANLTSVTQIKVPNDYSATGVGFQKPVTWRITDGDIGGAWPNYRDAQGNEADMSAIASKASQQDWTAVSPFTVPGTGEEFTVSGYGTPMGPQEMSFILTADTDGTWAWPVNSKTGRELPRPQIKFTFTYTISNYDDGGTCKERTDYEDFGSGGNNDTAGGHCLQGDVPTIWPLPVNKDNMWKRVPDATVTDKDGKSVKNVPTATFDYAVLASCLKKDELVVQDTSSKKAPAVGADYAWDIRLAGTVSSFSGC